MAKRTSQKAATQAAANLHDGNYSFRVLSAERVGTTSQQHYVVALPMATTHSGPFGWVEQAISGESGKSTKFGLDLFETFNDLDVELTLDNNHPHVVRIFVPMDTEQPFAATVRGLPEAICLAIEQAILRNHGLGQRFAEWLRRL